MHETPEPQDPGRDENPPGMPPGPGVPAGPGDCPELGSPHWRLVPQTPDWDEAYLAALADDEDSGDPEEYEDPDNAPPPGLNDAKLDALLAQAAEVTAERAQAAEQAARLGHTAVLAAMSAVSAGRRGPGMPGSADTVPGADPSPAAGFGSGQPLDIAAGCATLVLVPGEGGRGRRPVHRGLRR
jgi:hypothetical protein